MYEQTWVKLDADFGVPAKIFTVNMRSRLGQELLPQLQLLKDPTPENMKRLSDAVIDFIYRSRPLLGAGLSLCSITTTYMGMILNFWCTHPSFERTPFHAMPKEENLQTCMCGVPLPEKIWIGYAEGYSIEFCSEACMKKWQDNLHHE